MKLHDYQSRMVEFIHEQPRCYLALEVGMGKTRTVLEAIKDLPRPVLIVGPLRVTETVWGSEAYKWSYDYSFSQVLGPVGRRKAALSRDADIYLINVENLHWLREQYGRKAPPFKTVVFDEMTLFKSPGAKRTKAAMWAAKTADNVIALSGTPAPKSLLDLYSQIKVLDGGQRLGRSMQKYKMMHFHPTDYMQYNWEVRPGHEEKIHYALSDIMVSLTAEDYLDMPDMIVNDIMLDIGGVMEDYDELVKEMFLEVQDEEIDAVSAGVLVNKLAQFASGAIYTDGKEYVELHDDKIRAFTDIVEESNGQPILLVYNYKHTLERLKMRHTIRTVNEASVGLWNDGAVPILAIHQSAGHGLNLQDGGHIIVWVDATWNAESWIQTNARLHRQGQGHPVMVHRLITDGTIDVEMARRVGEKISVQNLLMEALK